MALQNQADFIERVELIIPHFLGTRFDCINLLHTWPQIKRSQPDVLNKHQSYSTMMHISSHYIHYSLLQFNNPNLGSHSSVLHYTIHSIQNKIDVFYSKHNCMSYFFGIILHVSTFFT